MLSWGNFASTKFCTRTDPDNILNTFIYNNRSGTGQFEWKAFVRILNDSASNTEENWKSYGEFLARWMDSVAQSDLYVYKEHFHFAGDTTKVDKLQPLGELICMRDTFAVIQACYADQHLSEQDILNNDDLMEAYFGIQGMRTVRNARSKNLPMDLKSISPDASVTTGWEEVIGNYKDFETPVSFFNNPKSSQETESKKLATRTDTTDTEEEKHTTATTNDPAQEDTK